MEKHFPTRRDAPANGNQVFKNGGRDPRVARDVAPGMPWAFDDHRSMAEVIIAERGR